MNTFMLFLFFQKQYMQAFLEFRDAGSKSVRGSVFDTAFHLCGVDQMGIKIFWGFDG